MTPPTQAAESADSPAAPKSDSQPTSQSGVKRVDMTQGPVFGHLRRFMLPMSFGITASMLVGLIDMFWLGKLGVTAQAAATLGFPVGFAVFSVAIGLSAGAVACISPAVSAGDDQRVRELATDAILLGLLAVSAVAVIGATGIGAVFRAMGAEGELLHLATLYMRIWFFGIIFVAGPVIGSAILRSVGQAVLPSIMMVMTAVINMILDPLLIFGLGPFPALGVAGAAWATVIANAFAFVLIGYLLIVREGLVTTRLRSWAQTREHWARIAQVGLPAAGSNMINPIALVLISASFTRLGEEALAGFGVASRIEMFATIPLFAMSAAMAPVVGQNLGAGRMDRVRETFRESFKFSVGYAVVMAAVLAVFGGLLVSGFTDDPDAQSVARLALLITPVTMWGYGAVFTAAAGLNGLSRPLPALAMTVGRSLGLYAPAAWIGGLAAGVTGAFVGMGVANVLAGAFVIWVVLARVYPPSGHDDAPGSGAAPTQTALR